VEVDTCNFQTNEVKWRCVAVNSGGIPVMTLSNKNVEITVNFCVLR